MPKAEIGSTKHLNNKLKSKGLQRLRWYCQVCERQMRDENGFKMHTQSESHVRQMLLVGEDPKKYINDYSNQFQRDFLQLLRTSHGEKKVQLNHFYQEYIANKEHVHMNSTKWPSLTEFAKFVGREGICRVEEDEKGVHMAWIDNSPEALRRQDAIRKKERQDKGDEEREQALIRQQVKRAKADAEERGVDEELDGPERELKRTDGEKIKLSFGGKPSATKEEQSSAPVPAAPEVREEDGVSEPAPEEGDRPEASDKPAPEQAPPTAAKVSMKMGFSNKPKNVFVAAKKNASGGKKAAVMEQPKKMSEAERIMKEEMAKKRGPSGFGGPAQKKQRF
ncbi:domain of Kin17 curved DNA-binding protein-domain-containing protein [Amylocarpus encephaloides]|uniref:Domain of Kin17 curved DNA-binding protein-domain-containing protein n=1 Tax=Amylocarpus encephaloides TaxID=45428 RepID=A0A9P8C2L3_9HELO|nr:domain of Kin17 curved DNA-binding protein-domain-containing protein [Amylocarpus encephaloides]